MAEVESAIRGGQRSGYARKAVVAGFWLMALKLVAALLVFWFMANMVSNAFKGIPAPRAPVVQAVQSPGSPQPVRNVPNAMIVPADATAGNATVRPVKTPGYRPPTPEEIRKSQREADEALKIIEANTPEM